MIAIVDYGASNLVNVQSALERLGAQTTVVQDAERLSCVPALSGLVLPGVGHAKSAMQALREHGFTEPLQRPAVPVLGICLGLQLFCATSEEGGAKLLGRFDLQVRRIRDGVVPRMGWCEVTPAGSSLCPSGAYYFAHSYAVTAAEAGPLCTAATEEGFAAVLDDGLVAATQFHPEKSGALGAQLLSRFLGRCGEALPCK